MANFISGNFQVKTPERGVRYSRFGGNVYCDMNNKFNGKYRIESARRQKWDYRWDAGYFITICTKNRQHFFGEINDGKMKLSHQGILADVFWHEIDTKNSASNFTTNEGEFLIKDSM